MGFTFSHPALILPFKYLPRKWYSVTGLVVGSMVPDFEYFIRWNNVSRYSHTFPGLFWFDIPAALFIAIIYHQFIRDSLITNLPDFLKSRFLRFCHLNWLHYLKQNWLVVLSSILIGAITHIFWDSFTSISGYVVRNNDLFRTKVNVMGMEMVVYKIIKHLTSVFGALILIYQLFLLPKHEIGNKRIDKMYWLILFSLSFVGILLQVLIINHHISFNGIIKKAITSGLIALLIASIYNARAEKNI